MTEFVTRNVTVIDFSDPRNIQMPRIYQLESSIIKLKHASIDIGSNCYLIRDVDINGRSIKVIKNNQGIGVIRVSLDSFEKRRIALLRKLVEYIAHLANSRSQSSLSSSLNYLLAFFKFYWSQSDLDCFQPQNQAHYEEAARRYSANLNANEKISSAYKSILTRAVFNFAEHIYDQDILNSFDYDTISNPEQNKNITKPMLPEEQELALALRSAIFESVVDLLINKKTIPHPLKVPSACEELNDTIWLGYSPWKGLTPFPRQKDFKKKQPKEWFNRDLGALVTREQWLERDDHINSKQGYDHWGAIQAGLKAKNLENSKLKQIWAEYACLCFLDLLLSMTGMNQQAALDLPWFGGYFVQKTQRGRKTVFFVSPDDQAEIECAHDTTAYLRSIKNRKGYQPVEVTISNRFLPKFITYLQLREYYLTGASDVRLFPFAPNLMRQKRNYLNIAFPEIPRLGPRQARANLSDNILTEEDDPHVAAQVLQNTPSTIIKHYAAGTQKAHIQGMGGFFNELDNQIRVTRVATMSTVETSVGSCNQGGNQPEPMPDSSFEPNCSQQEGCFFCKHYSVHADEIDIRKLFSVLYYINKGATRASNISVFNDLFGLVINRIKNLLEQIGAISTQKKQLVSRIEEEVYIEEELDEYWLCKLNRLETLIGAR